MPDAPLRVSQAARELGLSTKQVLELIRDGKLRYVMRDGIAHVEPAAIRDYLAKAS